MNWIYLSPHLDDVALSCGGLLWEQTQAGENVAIWTICAGDAPPGALSPFAESLHARWQTGPQTVAQRRAEDRLSAAQLGAETRHFAIPDCIYRRHPHEDTPLYASEESIFGELHPAEAGLVESSSAEISRALSSPVNLVCPLTLGNHVDHRLVRAAVDRLFLPSPLPSPLVGEGRGRGMGEVWYYADYPYVLRDWQENDARVAGMEAVVFPISADGLTVWGDSIAAHLSQVYTFWPDLEAMRAAIIEYSRKIGGARVWRRRALFQYFWF